MTGVSLDKSAQIFTAYGSDSIHDNHRFPITRSQTGGFGADVSKPLLK